MALYYAAASLLLASSLFFYSIQSTQRAEINLQIATIERALDQRESQVFATADPEAVAVVCPDPVVTRAEKPQITQPVAIRHEVNDSLAQTIAVMQLPPSPEKHISEQPMEEVPLEKQDAPPTRKQILPILGLLSANGDLVQRNRLQVSLFGNDEYLKTSPVNVQATNFASFENR
ncbi:MAG: hypothetical protein SH819_04770 [Cytophagales bacterium]|nr:hypothetical protein [Cytophagales bacterium]